MSEAYDAWFKAKVQEALNDPRPAVSDAHAKAHMKRLKAEILRLAKTKL
jgi:DNA-damage-inducible protein J